MMIMSARLDDLRARAFGFLGARGRKLNDALGRPLAPKDELEDRRAFATGYSSAHPEQRASEASPKSKEAAPVLVYHLDKHRRDLPRFTQVLDAAEIPYKLVNLEGDEAALAAVRRDSHGKKLPLVFIAGDCIGGREEMTAMDKSGELRKRVWGS